MSLPGQLLLYLSKQHLNLFSETIWRINVNELRPLLNLTLMYFHEHNTHGNLKPRKIKTQRNWTNTTKSEFVLIPYIFKRRSFKCVFSELKHLQIFYYKSLLQRPPNAVKSNPQCQYETWGISPDPGH